MRIVHVIEGLDPAAGGPPMVAARLAAAQASLGHEVTLLSYAQPRRQAQIDAALRDVPHLERCRIETLPRPSGTFNWIAARAGRRKVTALLDGGGTSGPTGVLHLHGVWEPLLRGAAGAARRAGGAYVVRPAGMLDTWSLAQKKWKKKLALLLGYRRMLNGALFLHALNADEKRLIEPLRLRCPIEVIPNGVFLEEIEPLPARGSFRSQHSQLGDRPFVLFLSRLHPKKGLDYLADAFARVATKDTELRLVVAGPDGGAEADFRSRVAAARLTDRVHVVGPLYGREKLAALVDATVFCLPSRQEGFSVAITEALACGLPVVISEACHFPEVAEAGAGEVVPLEASAVAAALSRVLADAALRQRMSAAGRELIVKRYTWPRIAAQTVEAYQRHYRRAAAEAP